MKKEYIFFCVYCFEACRLLSFLTQLLVRHTASLLKPKTTANYFITERLAASGYISAEHILIPCNAHFAAAPATFTLYSFYYV
jgi:hypothetical protein